jgi:hypothetical protein
MSHYDETPIYQFVHPTYPPNHACPVNPFVHLPVRDIRHVIPSCSPGVAELRCGRDGRVVSKTVRRFQQPGTAEKGSLW